MKFSVACGVCGERLEWEQTGDTSWGSMPVTEQGCVSVTVQDSTGVVSKHWQKHAEDGSFRKAFNKQVEYEKTRYDNLKERGLLDD